MAKDLPSAVVGALCLFTVLTVASTGPMVAGDPASFRGFGGCEVSGGPAHTVTIERSRVRVRGAAAPAPLPRRATHVFRRELDEWKLQHGHADHNVTRAAP
jgi:hypothetical protein